MRPRLIILLFLMMLALAEPASSNDVFPYNDAEIDAVTRATVGALIALCVYLLSVLQQQRSKRPSWDMAIAQAGLTAITALVAVLLVRSMGNDNLAVEWLVAAVVGSEGPVALRWLRDRVRKMLQREDV